MPFEAVQSKSNTGSHVTIDWRRNGVTAERGPEKVERGRRWGSAKAERGHRWSAGKRSAVLNFYLYRTPQFAFSDRVHWIYGAYAKYMRTHNYKIPILNSLLINT